MHRRAILAAIIGIVATGCDDNHSYNFSDTANPLAPVMPAITDTMVEFRVSGDLPNVTVRISNSLDGLTQVTTVLPYSQRIVFRDESVVFLSLDARATSGSGFLHVAIFVNGILFREASTSTFAPYVAVSGTYRRPRN